MYNPLVYRLSYIIALEKYDHVKNTNGYASYDFVNSTPLYVCGAPDLEITCTDKDGGCGSD